MGKYTSRTCLSGRNKTMRMGSGTNVFGSYAYLYNTSFPYNISKTPRPHLQPHLPFSLSLFLTFPLLTTIYCQCSSPPSTGIPLSAPIPFLCLPFVSPLLHECHCMVMVHLSSRLIIPYSSVILLLILGLLTPQCKSFTQGLA